MHAIKLFLLIGMLCLITACQPEAPSESSGGTLSGSPAVVDGKLDPERFPSLDEWECAPGVGFEECMHDKCRMGAQLNGDDWLSSCGPSWRDAPEKWAWREAEAKRSARLNSLNISKAKEFELGRTR